MNSANKSWGSAKLDMLNRRASPSNILHLSALLTLLLFVASTVVAAESWSAKFDRKVRFYQSTELGVLIVGTEKSLYAVDGTSGDVLWRRKNVKLDETDVAPVPGTDIVLLTPESGSKTRVEALDLMTGAALWRSDKVRGAVMQMALDQNVNLLALVLVRDARSKAKEGFIDDRLLDRLDPAHQLERLSRFLLRTQRFYTDLGRGNGLAGVNINSRSTERSIRMSAPDDRFLSDEEANLLYVS